MLTKESLLVDEPVLVKFLFDMRNGITDPKHPLYGGLSSNASIGIPAPVLRGGVERLFGKDELAILAKELNEPHLKNNSTFWREYRKNDLGMPAGIFPIHLKKEGLLLNKKDALDFIKIRILEDAPIVASSPGEVKNKKSQYRFVLVKYADKHKEDIANISAKKKAVKLHTKYEDDDKILKFILRGFGKHVGNKHTSEFLQNETWKQVEANPGMFVKILEDEFITEKVLIYDLLAAKLINKSNKLYFSKESEPLKLDGDTNDLDGAARYLASGVGQDLRIELEAKLKFND